MKIPAWVLVAAAILGGLLFWQGYGCEERRHAKLQAQIEAAENRVEIRNQMIEQMQKNAEIAERNYRAKVRPEVKAAIAAVDSNPTPENARNLARKCEALVVDCDARVAAKDSIIRKQDSTITDKNEIIADERKKQSGGWGDCVAGAGYAGKFGFGGMCGVSIRRLVRVFGGH